MIKSSDVVLTGLMIVAAVWTFQVKFETKISARKVADLQKSISKEDDRIDILTADWAVLNQPSNLQIMAERFGEELQLQPLEIEQIATLDELPPMKVVEDPIGAIATEAGEIDTMATGSIKRAAE